MSNGLFIGYPADSAFVGRERELLELRAAVEDVRSGHGRLFLISGQPGIGKSRLADELAGYVASRGILVLRAEGSEGGGTPAYWPFVQLVRAGLHGTHRNTLINQLTAECSPHVIQDVGQLVPELRHLARLSPAPPEPPSSDVEQTRFRLTESVAIVIKTLAGIRPLLLVVEDLHDTDQASLQMLRFLVRQLKSAPVLVLGTYRDAEVRHSRALSQLIGELVREGTPVPLVGLTREQTAAMIGDRAGTPPPARLVLNIHQATAGNPLFIDGLVRILAAEGKLSSTSRLDLAVFRVPDGVREAIRHWLALVSDRSVLVVAATIGQQFDLRCLQQVSQIEKGYLIEALHEASRLGIVTVVSHGVYRFSHALIRNALTDEVSSADRATLHLKIGETQEELYQADIGAHVADLARHFREAGEFQRAVDYSIRAGEAARSVFAYEDAVLHWQAALQLLSECPDEKRRYAALLESLGELEGSNAVCNDDHLRDMEQALKIYEDLGDLEAAARVHARLGLWFTVRGTGTDISKAFEHYQRAENLLSEGPDSVALVLLHQGFASATSQGINIEGGLIASQRAMEMSERLGQETMWASACIVRGSCLFGKGRLGECFALLNRAFQKINSVLERLPALNVLNETMTGLGLTSVRAYALIWLYDPVEAAALVNLELGAARSVEASLAREALLNWIGISYVLTGRLIEASNLLSEIRGEPLLQGQIAFYRGEWEKADRVLLQAIDSARVSGRRTRACCKSQWLAKARKVLGEYSSAEVVLEDVLAMCIEGPHLPLEIHTRQELVRLYAETGRPKQAHAHLARCHEIMATGENWRGLAGHVARAEAAVAAAESRFETANGEFVRAVKIFHRYRVPFEEAETLHCWGQALLAAGDPLQALEKLDAAAELYGCHGAGERWLKRVGVDRLRAQGAATSTGGHEVVMQPPDLPSRLESRNEEDGGKYAEAEGIFHKSGDYWTLSWAGSKLKLRDRKGLRYIAYLLRHPGQEFPVQELVCAIENVSSVFFISQKGASQRDHTHTIAYDLGDAGVALDAPAKAQYRRRLEDLHEELKLAKQLDDPGKIAKTRHEIEFIEDQIAASVGLRGRDRKIASHAERARLNATKSIKSAVKLIREADTELARHLSLSIKTGYFCSYIPGSPVNWQL